MKNPILRQLLLFLFCWRFKRHFVALCATQLLTLDFSLQAQSPQGIPYQAIARNASGVAIANTAVKVRFTIRDSIANGAIKYQETHNPTTSALGLFSVNVGMGTVVSGTFSGINWGKNAKFLQVEMDPAGGATYTDLGTTQMMSVPYAMFAGAAASTTQPNSNYNPSLDSVLTLTSIANLAEGSFLVPSQESWKIVSIVIPSTSGSTTIKFLKSGCSFSPYYNKYECQYRSDLFSIKVGSYSFPEYSAVVTPDPSPKEYVTSCDLCPEFLMGPFVGFNGSNYSQLKLPIWIKGGERLEVGHRFLISVEKYR